MNIAPSGKLEEELAALARGEDGGQSEDGDEAGGRGGRQPRLQYMMEEIVTLETLGDIVPEIRGRRRPREVCRPMCEALRTSWRQSTGGTQSKCQPFIANSLSSDALRVSELSSAEVRCSCKSSGIVRAREKPFSK